jgi:hypothetical protein
VYDEIVRAKSGWLGLVGLEPARAPDQHVPPGEVIGIAANLAIQVATEDWPQDIMELKGA